MQNDEIIKEVLPFRAKLYRFCFNIVNDEHDTEDILQELLIKIWQKREDFIQIENKEAWCMTVTRNMAIDKIRSRKNRTSNIDDHLSISDQGPTPDKQTEQKDALESVMNIVNGLPIHQKEIILLRDVEGHTYKEIAEITNASEDQVKVALFRARQKLKEKLKNIRIN